MKMVKFCAIAALAVVCAPAFAAIRAPSAKSSKPEVFVLKDAQRTGAWVVAFPVPDGYVGDGKVFWVNEPSWPCHWALSMSSKDGDYKAFLNDGRSFVKVFNGDLEDVPEFSTAEGFAGLLAPMMASTYGLSDVQIRSASYTPYQPKESDVTRLNRQINKETHYCEFKALFTGTRKDGRVAAVIFLSSMSLMVSASADMFCTLYVSNGRSCAYPPGASKRAMAMMAHLLGTFTPNLEFGQYVANLSRDATSRWVKSQNEQQEQFQKVMSDRQDAYDRSFEAWRSVIKETETVSAGGNEAYEVPWGADNSYVDENGGIVQKSNDEFLEKSRRSGRTVDQERQSYESEHRTLRKLAPLKKPGNF